MNDDHHIYIDKNSMDWLPVQGNLEVMPLHTFNGENIALVRWPVGETFQPHTHAGGEEIYVMSGEFIDENGRYPAGTWIRSPHISNQNPYVEVDTLIWVM